MPFAFKLWSYFPLSFRRNKIMDESIKSYFHIGYTYQKLLIALSSEGSVNIRPAFIYMYSLNNYIYITFTSVRLFYKTLNWKANIRCCKVETTMLKSRNYDKWKVKTTKSKIRNYDVETSKQRKIEITTVKSRNYDG